MKRLEAVNDFVVKFANVNGSGSASANELFAKAILRMGVPVSPRNIFPSNIQGLPTWYEVRVSERGWLGRRGGIDMMVAMNPQTWDQDVAEPAWVVCSRNFCMSQAPVGQRSAHRPQCRQTSSSLTITRWVLSAA